MRYSFLLIATILAAPAACARNTDTETGALEAELHDAPVGIRVDNRGWSDATIYLVYGGAAFRVGFAPGLTNTTLWISRNQLPADGGIRLRVRPIGGPGLLTTEPVYVQPGQLVHLTVENELWRSRLVLY